MGDIKPNQLVGIALRIVVVLIVGIGIWKVITYLDDVIQGDGYSQGSHLIIALITTILTFLLLLAALKFDKLRWNQLGQGTVKKNFVSFLLGFFLWVIPAAVGFVVCMMLGWVEFEVLANWDSLLVSIGLLCITVFFMEALPEEFIFRGYVYRYLNVLFPHWVTIILQTVFFSLFAYFIGAMYSVEQIQFIPGFAIILGIFRAISGSVWTSIGFHVAIMTATQMLGPVHGHFEVTNMFTLQFVAFILLPSTIGAIVLSFVFKDFKWGKKEPF